MSRAEKTPWERIDEENSRAREIEANRTIQGQMDVASNAMYAAKKSGDREAWDAAKAILEELRAKQYRRAADVAFRKICPVQWTHAATEEDIEAKILNGAMRAATHEDFGARCVLLLGPSKVGKSAAMALMLKRQLVRKANAAWFYARALCAAPLQHSLGDGPVPEIEAAAKTPLLVLDDLGIEKDHGPLLDVIHERYEQNRPTWTTSGLTLPQLGERYGDAIVRRLVESNGNAGRVISCFGKPK